MALEERLLLLCTSGATPGKEESTKKFLGRVSHINLQSRRLHSLEGIEVCTGIKYLYAYDNVIQELPNGFQNCRSLQGLYMDHNDIVTLDGIQHAPNLQVLLLGHNAVQVVSTHVSACVELRELSLAHQRLPEDTPLYFEPGVLSSLARSLTSLDVSGCGLRNFHPFGALMKLKRFIATDNHVDSVEDAAALVSRLPHLEELDVRRNLLTQTAGPGGAYRSVLLTACFSSNLHTLDGKPVSTEHLMFMNALSTRRAGPDGGGTVGSSLLPIRGRTGFMRGGGATPMGRQVGTSSTGREPGSIGHSYMGPSPATGTFRSSPGFMSIDGYENEGAGDDSDDLISLGDTRKSGRIVPVSVMKSHAKGPTSQRHGNNAPMVWASQAKGGAVLAGRQVQEYDALAAAAAYAAMHSGTKALAGGAAAGAAHPNGHGPDADSEVEGEARSQLDTPGSHPSTANANATKRALTFASPTPALYPKAGQSQQQQRTAGSAAIASVASVGGPPSTAVISSPAAPGQGGNSHGSPLPSAHAQAGTREQGGDMDLDLSDAAERAPEDTPGAPGRAAGRTVAAGPIFGSPMDTTLPRNGAGLTPAGPSAWKGPRQQPSFLDTHITEEGEGMGETGSTAADRLGVTGGQYSQTLSEEGTLLDGTMDSAMDSIGSMDNSLTDDASSIPRPANILELLHSRGRISSRGSARDGSGTFDGGPSHAGPGSVEGEAAWEGSADSASASSAGGMGLESGADAYNFSDTMSFAGTMGSLGTAGSTGGHTGRGPGSGRPPLAPLTSSGMFAAAKPPVRMVEVPRGNGKPPLMLPMPEYDPNRIGTASGFVSQLARNPQPYTEVDAPRRTPHDFMRGSRFRDSEYSRPDERKRAAHAAALQVLSHRGPAVPSHLVGGLDGATPARPPKSNRKGPRPVGDIVGGAPTDYLIGGVLANYVVVSPKAQLDLHPPSRKLAPGPFPGRK